MGSICSGIAEFIGFIGLAEPSFNAHFTPAVEVGWRSNIIVNFLKIFSRQICETKI